MTPAIADAVGPKAADLMSRLGYDDRKAAAVAIRYDGAPLVHLEGDLFAAYLKKQFDGEEIASGSA